MGNRQTTLLRPEYSNRFRCIGPACEDSCCVGWTVQFDKATCQKYDALPPTPLREHIHANLIPLPLNPDGSAPIKFASVQLTADHACPFLSADKLCQIQTAHGEEYLSITCATYPRIKHRIDDLEETALSLSCPEAARLVLLTPNLLAQNTNGHYQMTWDEAALSKESIQNWFWPLREFVLRLITNRRYPLWQRIFLLGSFLRRLEALHRGELDRSFADLLNDFTAAIDSGSLCATMETLPADLNLQLDLVLRLAGLRLNRSHIGPRFIETLNTFTQGIGNHPNATMETLIAHYSDAYQRFYAPFFKNHPHILENLFVNTIFRTLFPFANEGIQAGATPKLSREFALLATQFALIKGLLIGVAGHYKESFSTKHIVETVQTTSKHFEHHPSFLDQAYALLTESQLDNPRGLTMLIRN